jgi:hypothetical protein
MHARTDAYPSIRESGYLVLIQQLLGFLGWENIAHQSDLLQEYIYIYIYRHTTTLKCNHVYFSLWMHKP